MHLKLLDCLKSVCKIDFFSSCVFVVMAEPVKRPRMINVDGERKQKPESLNKDLTHLQTEDGNGPEVTWMFRPYHLYCIVCQGPTKEPLSLSCGHFFCGASEKGYKSCFKTVLDSYVVTSTDGKSKKSKCPICQKLTKGKNGHNVLEPLATSGPSTEDQEQTMKFVETATETQKAITSAIGLLSETVNTLLAKSTECERIGNQVKEIYRGTLTKQLQKTVESAIKTGLSQGRKRAREPSSSGSDSEEN